MVLFYLVAYLFGNMGAFLVVEAVARSEGSDEHRRLPRPGAALAACWRSAMLLFLLSLGGIPFVAGFWAKLYVFWAAVEQGLYWLVLPRRGADRRRALLLPARRQAHVHRRARAARRRSGGARCSAFCIFLCVLGVVVMGVYPKPLVVAALRAVGPPVLEEAGLR